MLSRIMAHAEPAFASETAEACQRRLLRGDGNLRRFLSADPSLSQAGTTLTSASHWAAGGFITRLAPANWPGSPAFDYVCFECNPLLGAIRESRTRYRFTDFAPRGRAQFGLYWEALSEARINDALCSTSYGADGAIASLHLGFHERDFTARRELCHPDGRSRADRTADEPDDATARRHRSADGARARQPGAGRRGQDGLGDLGHPRHRRSDGALPCRQCPSASSAPSTARKRWRGWSTSG